MSCLIPLAGFAVSIIGRFSGVRRGAEETLLRLGDRLCSPVGPLALNVLNKFKSGFAGDDVKRRRRYRQKCHVSKKCCHQAGVWQSWGTIQNHSLGFVGRGFDHGFEFFRAF